MKSSRTLLQSLAVSALCTVSTLFAADAPKPAPAPAKPAAELETKTDWTPRYTINLGYDNVYKVHGEAVSEDPAFSMGMTMHVGDFFLRFRGSRAEEQSSREGIYNETSSEMFSDYDISLGYDWKLKDLPLVGDVTLTLAGTYQRIAPAYSGALGRVEQIGFLPGTAAVILQGLEMRKQYFEDDNFYFSFALSLDDVLLTPNASINWNPDGGILWGQFGIKYDYALSFISEKLNWNNSLDFYWFANGFLDSYEVYEVNYAALFVNGVLEDAIYDPRKYIAANTAARLATCTWRSTLSYAFNETTTVSVYGGIDYYISEMLFVRDQFDSIWGAALTFSF